MSSTSLAAAERAWTLPGDDVHTPRAARELAAEAVGSRAVPELLCDDVREVVSELVTNACVHTRSGRPGGVVGLSVAVDATGVTVIVTDQGRDDEVCPVVSPVRVTGGLGLRVCAELGALDWWATASGRRVRVRLMDVAEVPL